MFNSYIKDIEIISPKEAKKRMSEDKNIILVDVRRPEEYSSGHIPNSISIPLDQLKILAPKLLKNKKADIFVYCFSGARSSMAATILDKMGYTNIYNLGGISRWPYEITK